MIVYLPKRVSILADQLSKILLIFSIKLELRDLSSKVENHTPKAKTFSFAQVIGLLEGKVRLKLLEGFSFFIVDLQTRYGSKIIVVSSAYWDNLHSI